jgi:hypothetical protein
MRFNPLEPSIEPTPNGVPPSGAVQVAPRRLTDATFHVANEMDGDELSVFDRESIILTGQSLERQRDEATRQRKYVLWGDTLTRQAACCVVAVGPTGEVIFITVWAE